ncbi:glycoside hydrolase family 3 N-terminal domain-containing protein [Candidatus Leptofilum sp.]|uniref:glycoside hydrolase family 3 N-terminal domain-containing protein n=1 Tax=Candidatus Leptofilum sp. TaxID=3241576 RepID=UPI003B5A34F1
MKIAIYQDANQPVEERAADLLARMTLDEKLAQLGSAWVFELLTDMQFDAQKAAAILQHGLGHITRVAGASSLKPREGAALANRIQGYLREETRLGIPAIVHEECCSGYMARNATCFPQIIGLASTWETELTRQMADVVRRQMKAAGAHQGLSPLLDVVRDPRWGRVEETFGEDPYLVALNGVQFMQGLQGENWDERVIATAKHFVGYGVPDGGFNWNPAHIPARELREIYLLPFETAVKEANLQSVMNGYNELDGIPCAANEELLDTILRQEWGFDGVVVSDYFAVDQLQVAHHVTANKSESAVRALAAGIDVELPGTDCYGAPLQTAVAQGQIDEALIDRSVTRLLRQKFALGLFENPFVDAEAVVLDTPAERQLAREIAQKSIILLKNEDDLLPLPKNLTRIAVIGPQADSTRHLVGDYSYIAHIENLIESREQSLGGLGMPMPDELELDEAFIPMNTILQAVQEKVSVETEVVYAKGCAVLGDDRSGFEAAVTAATNADVALLFLGGKSGLTDDCTCGEARDRADLNLTGVQQELLEAVYATGTPTVLVLVNGRPLSTTWAADNTPAILEAWLPGEEGAEAVADVLFGDCNPGGKLPITVPRGVGQVPIFYNHKPSGGRSHWKGDYVDLSHKPLWPFGYGLSYTQFDITNLRLDKTAVATNHSVNISVEIANVGQRAGSEVVQLYVRDEVASVTRPLKELRGFQRVHLEPGEQRTLTFTLAANQLAFYDSQMRFVLEPGTVRLMLGTSSDDLPLVAEIEVVGETAVLTQKTFFTQVTIV